MRTWPKKTSLLLNLELSNNSLFRGRPSSAAGLFHSPYELQQSSITEQDANLLGRKICAMKKKVPPRIYCIPASEAPVVAVFRRGPTNWSHVGRWDLAAGRYEPGAWLRRRIFPRRSDLSPDGRLLCYFAHKPTAQWEQGESYVALSKLPWLTALHAFSTCGTWTRGFFFTEDGGFDNFQDAKLPI